MAPLVSVAVDAALVLPGAPVHQVVLSLCGVKRIYLQFRFLAHLIESIRCAIAVES